MTEGNCGIYVEKTSRRGQQSRHMNGEREAARPGLEEAEHLRHREEQV